jgi:1-acyl-sn-glycerol-3-phosphate acyltransferase
MRRRPTRQPPMRHRPTHQRFTHEGPVVTMANPEPGPVDRAAPAARVAPGADVAPMDAPEPPAVPDESAYRWSADEPDVWDTRVAGALAFLRRRLTGQYDVDEFGFDPELNDNVIQPLLDPLYREWFRVEVTGAKNVPLDRAGLVVANHSGTIALDAVMLSHAVHQEPQIRRNLRLLGADLVFRVPFVSELARKSGATLACAPDAERLLRGGELVGVFPEGFKGVGKHYRDRYKLQRFGRGGFVAAALATGTPIVPVAIVGAEETYPMLGNVKPLARLLGIPYFPVTPTFPWLGPLGLIPLPSKWLIEFGTPIETEHLQGDVDDPMVVFNLADQVRETIQQILHELLARRPDAF